MLTIISVLIALVALFVAIFRYLKSLKLSLHQKIIVITGCDTGFGFHLSKRLTDAGAYVISGCLSANSEGAIELKNYSQNITIIELDVTKDDSVGKFKTQVENICGNKGIWALVNNAGIGFFGETELMFINDFEKIIQVNAIGPVRMAKAMIGLIRQNRGRIVNIASMASHMNSPGLTAYCMSKSAILSFNNCLRLEMTKFGVSSISIEPSFFRTNIVMSELPLTKAKEYWSALDEKTRAIYPPGFENRTKDIHSMFQNMAIESQEPVLSSIEHAISAVYPYRHYTMPTSAFIIKILVHILPSFLIDKMIKFPYKGKANYLF